MFIISLDDRFVAKCIDYRPELVSALVVDIFVGTRNHHLYLELSIEATYCNSKTA